MRVFGGAAVLAASVLAAGCGGGGGSVSPGSPPVVPSSTPGSPTTQAVGTLVDDPSGTPLAGVTVRLDPWQWGSGPVSGAPPLYTPPPNLAPGPSPTPLAVSTTDPTGHFTIAAPNGTYLLVIGSDDSADTTRPTIHDRVVLNGQSILAAPTMPPVPGITPAPVELNGDYRLVTIDQTTELPCITDYDAQRTQRGLPKPVIDEWLTENVRAWVSQSITPFNGQTSPGHSYGFLTTGNQTVTGGTDCSDMVGPTFALPNQWAISPAAYWYAAAYRAYNGKNGNYPAYGAGLFPLDPRIFADPNAVFWP